MKKLLLFLKRNPALMAALTVALCYVSVKLLDSDTEGNAASVILRLLLTIVCGAVLYAISGKKSFENLDQNIGYVIKKYSGFLIFSALLGVISLATAIAGGAPLVSGWPKVLFFLIAELILVGLFEELCFRVIINDGLLYQFRGNKHIFAWIGLITTLVFGWIHVASAASSSPLAIAQAVLKTSSAGIMGFALLILYWKTRNFWAIALAHALYDSLPLIAGQLFDTGAKVGSYVTEETKEINGAAVNMGAAQAVIFAVQTVIFILFTLALLKVLKSIDFEKMRREW
jgi:membrane protease YdiL (CAAX protease family)